ncbi:MAG: hypothetical protein NTY41_09295, partial [Proteobacteria bacterium]|nr:hypothetical protein [Pseudomonadota bacterium]
AAALRPMLSSAVGNRRGADASVLVIGFMVVVEPKSNRLPGMCGSARKRDCPDRIIKMMDNYAPTPP